MSPLLFNSSSEILERATSHPLPPCPGVAKTYWIYLCKASSYYFSFSLYLNSGSFSLVSMVSKHQSPFQSFTHLPGTSSWSIASTLTLTYTIIIFLIYHSKGSFTWAALPGLLLSFQSYCYAISKTVLQTHPVQSPTCIAYTLHHLPALPLLAQVY